MNPRDHAPTCSFDPLDDSRVAAAVAEYQAELDAGRHPDPAAFLTRHPDVADVLAGCLRALNYVQHAVHGPPPAATPRARELGPGIVVGEYRLVREVGRGGMGVVFEAEQRSLGRRVALKVLPSAALDERALQRFRHEAQAAAALQHPHIVPVYAVGNDGDVHYFAMQFVDGRSLANVVTTLRTRGPASPTPGANTSDATAAHVPTDTFLPALPAPAAEPVPTSTSLTVGEPGTPAYYREVARLLGQVADALQHAHEFGVVHRDVKPGNLLLDTRGEIWVADFGLAKLPGSDLTGTADLMGTIRYMSPEQASGRAVAVDGRTDVYSLGVTLYELLTLEPAFDADDRRALLRKVMEEEPVPPRKRNPAVPADLATIALKAMAKEAAERYQTAAAFADDLRRFLDDRPIEAKPPTRVQRARKWARRNRVLVGVAGAVGLAGLVTTVGVLVASNAAIDRKRQEAEDAGGREAVARLAETDAKNQANERLTAERAARAAERQMVYIQTVSLAYREWEGGNVDRALALLDQCPDEYRRWEWGYIRAICRPELFQSGRLRTSAGASCALGVSDDGKTLRVIATGGKSHGWSLEDGRELAPLGDPGPFPLNQHVGPCAVSPAADCWWFTVHRVRVAVVGAREYLSPKIKPVPLTIVESGTTTTLDPVHTAPISAIALSPDGAWAVTGDAKGVCLLWDAKRRQVVKKFPAHTGPVHAAVFAADSSHFATLGGERTLKAWHRDRDREVWAVPHDWSLGSATWSNIRPAVLVFSPDGTQLAAGSAGGLVRILDARTGGLQVAFPAHLSAVVWVGFTADGAAVVTAGHDRILRSWSATTGRPGAVFRGSQGRLAGMALTPDGRHLAVATASPEGVHVWDLATRSDARPLAQIGASATDSGAVAFDPAGRFLAVTTPTEWAIVDASAGEKVRTLREVAPRRMYAELADQPLALDVSLGTGGECLVASTDQLLTYTKRPEPTARPLAVRTFAQGITPDDFSAPVSVPSLRLGGNGTAIYRSSGQAAHLVRPGLPPRLLAGHAPGDGRAGDKTVLGVGASPDGKLFATAGRHDHTVMLWDADGVRVRSLAGKYPAVAALVFSPDAGKLVIGQADGVAVVVDVRTGAAVARFTAPRLRQYQFAFSPDGTRIALALNSNRETTGGVAVFDAASGTQLIEIPWDCPVVQVAFRPDNRALAVLDARGVLWSLDAFERTPVERVADARRWEPQSHALRASQAMDEANVFALNHHAAQLPADSPLRARYGIRSGVEFLKTVVAQHRAGNLGREAARALNRHSTLTNLRDAYALAAQYLEAGNTAAYRDLCDHLRSLLTPTTPVFSASIVYRLCAFAPGGVADPGALARECEERLKGYTPFGRLYITGALQYRAGDFLAAEKTLLEAEAFEPGKGKDTRAVIQLFLAMTCHQSGQAERAKDWLAKADEWYARDVVARPANAKAVEYQILIPFPIVRKETSILLGVE